MVYTGQLPVHFALPPLALSSAALDEADSFPASFFASLRAFACSAGDLPSSGRRCLIVRQLMEGEHTKSAKTFPPPQGTMNSDSNVEKLPARFETHFIW